MNAPKIVNGEVLRSWRLADRLRTSRFTPNEKIPMTTTDGSNRRATIALTLLVLINLFNYIDRQVLAAVEPDIRKELLPDASGTQLTADGTPEESEGAKFWMGWLATAFLLSYMLIAPLFGMMADRISRWGLVGFGVILWTLASGASGLNWGNWGFSLGAAYWLLLITRCFVGVGEAAYGPVAPAMIADLYPLEKRGKVMAWFYLAIPVGGALGYALGGGIVKMSGEWRWAFYAVVPPGLLLGAWCLLMRDPPRGSADQPTPLPTRKPRLADYLFLLRIPSYTLNTLGMTMMTFAIGGLAYWMPAFLKQREKIARIADSGEVIAFLGIEPVTLFGGITALAGLISTLAGGLVGDWLRPRYAGSYFLVSGFALLLGFPMVLLVLWTPFPLAWIFVFFAIFFLFFNTGPTNTILANVTHPSMRASAFALNILIIHAFGDAISPPLLGWISGKEHLDHGFIVVSAAMLLGGVFWLMGAKFLQRDTENGPTHLPA
jgi:MFS transporter, Spinster family, sphingosine-1-phosphate transporter